MKFTQSFATLAGEKVTREIVVPESEMEKTFPEEVYVDGIKFTAKNQFDKYGYTWQSTAGGINLFFLSDNGKRFSIKKGLLQNRWMGEVQELIAKSGKTMKEVSELTEIPYRTIQDWRAGRAEPSNIAKIAFRLKMNEIINSENYWFVSADNNTISILVKNARSVDDAIEQFKNIVEVAEIVKDDKFSKHYLPHKIYIVKHGTTETGHVIAIK